MRCCGFAAAGEILQAVDPFSHFIVAFVIVMVLSSAWTEISQCFQSKPGKQNMNENTQQAKVYEPPEAKLYKSSHRYGIESAKEKESQAADLAQ